VGGDKMLLMMLSRFEKDTLLPALKGLAECLDKTEVEES
jgi:hypothetical protein